MESTSLPPASLDTTTTERGLTNEKSKITGHETDVSLTALQNSAGDPDNPRKNWKTQTKISKDQGTQVPLGEYEYTVSVTLHKQMKLSSNKD